MSFSLNELASLASNDLVKAILAPLATKLGTGLVGLTKEKWGKYTQSFERYLSDAESKHKYFSSQVFANEGQLLENYYVPLTLQKASSSKRQATVVVNSYPNDLMTAYKDVLIVDTAGMGKSTLLKFIFLQSLKVGQYIPIFVELRKLSKERSLLNFIYEELKIGKDELSIKLFNESLREGVFTFFLDGYDEIADSEKEVVSDQIIELKSRASSNRFILSSREEQSLAYLAEFHKFNIKPLEEDEAFTLIRKISPDPEIAESLVEKLQSKSQGDLKEFLTNPLLVSLLVKSFLHSPILPVRLSEFYRQVFDALFQTHDAKKELGGFSRKKKSNLDLDRFHKAMRALGVLTYKDNKLEFSTDELLAQIERVKVLTSDSGYSASSFQHDLLHAVPLFVQEGGVSRWAHRSLQEYFAASYICVDAKERQGDLLTQLYCTGLEKNANLLRLCADIDGKTFKHVLVKRYLTERLKAVDEAFTPEAFPALPVAMLEKRKSIIQSNPCALLVLPRAISQTGFRKFKWENVSNAPAGLARIPLTIKGDVFQNPQEKIKYVFAFGINEFTSMDAIIRTYYHENLLVSVQNKSVRMALKDMPTNHFFLFDSDPANPLNSNDNFEVSLQILLNISRYLQTVYNVDKMRKFYENVIKNEQNSSRLDISFA